MMVTTGARGTTSSGLSGVSVSVRTSSSLKAVDSIWNPNSLAISVAVSRSMSWLIVTPIMPRAQSFLTISRPCTAIFLASSATAMVSAIRTTRLCSAGVVICVCFSFLPAAATRFLGKLPGRWPPGPNDGRPKRSRPAGARLSRLLRPRRRSSSSRSLISTRGALASPPRGARPGSWMNAPVAAEPVTTGCGIALRPARDNGCGTGTSMGLLETGGAAGAAGAASAVAGGGGAGASTGAAGRTSTGGVGAGASVGSALATTTGSGARIGGGGATGWGAGAAGVTTGAGAAGAAVTTCRAGAGGAAATFERRRMTVPSTVRRSSTRLSCRSRSTARRIRSASAGSIWDMWLATSMAIARTLATRSFGWRPRSLASS